ncbi:unnamed protein product [Linum trigynum]|uniref:BHLH domain-containing protein n=1 Tax=Linum trigynum TaxID=586398 RepID=A0AAV2EZT4_9ROSI
MDLSSFMPFGHDPSQQGSDGFDDLSALINQHPSSEYNANAAAPEQPMRAASSSGSGRSGLPVPHHILAERKRREHLNKQFIALSANIPNLKKGDKATVLGEAIKYVKQLQERVNELHEKAKRTLVESIIFVKKSQVEIGEEFMSRIVDDTLIPEVEARGLDENVLIRIHCEKHQGLVARVVREVEKLHLTVLAINVVPFGRCSLDVTIVTKKDIDSTISMQDVVRDLQPVLLGCN